jgi:hypothetical protein
LITLSARASTLGGILMILDFRFWILDRLTPHPSLLTELPYLLSPKDLAE